MRRFFIGCAVGSLLVLASCAQSEKTLIASCSGAAVSLSTLADFRAQGKLTGGMIATVDKAVAVISPICDPKNPPPADARSTIATVDGAALPLVTIIQEVK